MTKAAELWEKYWDIEAYGQPVMTKSDFLAALHEYGQAVRDRDAECKELLREALTFIPRPTKQDVIGWKDNRRDKVNEFLSRADEALK